MGKIKSKYITISYVILTLFSLSFVAGAFKWYYLIFALLFLSVYLKIDKCYLRCPHCSGFINLDRLSYAKKHIYHCNHCGKRIEIDK